MFSTLRVGKFVPPLEHHLAALGHVGHLEARLVDAAAEDLAQLLLHHRVAHDLAAEAEGDALDGDVVVRRPDAARGEQQIVLRLQRPHRLGDLLQIVRDHQHAPQRHPLGAQSLRQVRGVGVHHLAGEDLVADDDESCGGLAH